MLDSNAALQSTDGEKTGRTLAIVFFTVFMDLVGFGIIIPIQPFFAETLGASPTLVTLLGASFSLMQFLFTPFWGRLSDRVGRRPIMLISIATSAVGYTIFGFSRNLPMLFASRMLAGFGSANIGTAQAIIADSTSPEQRAKGMGIIGAAFGLGFIFGPALGGAFGQISLSAPLFLAAGLAIVNWISAFFFLPETYKPGSMTTHSAAQAHPVFSIRRFQGYGKYPAVPRLFLMFLIFTTAFSMMEQVIGLFIENHWAAGPVSHETAKHAALLTTYVLLVVGVTSTIIQGGLIGRLVKKFGERSLLVCGTLLVAASFIGIPFAGLTGIYSIMLITAITMAVGTGFTNPSLSSLLSRSVGSSEQGSTLGLGQSLSALGRIIGPSVAGFLFEAHDSLPFWVGGVLLLTCTGIAFSILMGHRQAALTQS
jgi:MFS transporter, DHA1 family, tetracycline resistance protein